MNIIDLRKLEVYHTPTEKAVICLCLNMAKFTSDCEDFIISRYSRYSVNPKERFYSKVDKLVDDIIRDVKKVPYKFRMRLEKRHCIDGRNILYAFEMFDRASFTCDDFPAKIQQECMEAPADFVIVYVGMLPKPPTDTDGKGGFCGHKPQVPSLSDGACPVRDKPLGI